ncbi:MAG: ligase-associated DNA damage response endonuclease PdeM [Novosphingobium sp.]|nr:ligase-associated DNA damage response endonuclease PdeM [Novosphingobium sp.]
MVPFSFSSRHMLLVAGRAVFWPQESTLLVADLHLEKASHHARYGQMLPPYDSRETLERLALAIRKTGARRVFALGDSFHDHDGATRLDPLAAQELAALIRSVEWTWIAGNHDTYSAVACGGEVADEVTVSGLVLRHQTRAEENGPEVSGHFHPGLRIFAKRRCIFRPCAVTSETRLILPAFGALTGRLDARDPAILGAMQPARAIDAIVVAAGKALRFPLWRAEAMAQHMPDKTSSSAQPGQPG